MMISISRYLAFALGVLTPLAETIRRWSTWRDNPLRFLTITYSERCCCLAPGAQPRTPGGANAFLPPPGDSCAARPILVSWANFTITVWASLIRRRFHPLGLP